MPSAQINGQKYIPLLTDTVRVIELKINTVANVNIFKGTKLAKEQSWAPFIHIEKLNIFKTATVSRWTLELNQTVQFRISFSPVKVNQV